MCALRCLGAKQATTHFSSSHLFRLMQGLLVSDVVCSHYLLIRTMGLALLSVSSLYPALCVPICEDTSFKLAFILSCHLNFDVPLHLVSFTTNHLTR